MPHEGCGDKNLAMAPWSVGKYAKRAATLHLGSEDQLLLNASNTTVLSRLSVLFNKGQGGGFVTVRVRHTNEPPDTVTNLAEFLQHQRDLVDLINEHSDYLSVSDEGKAGETAPVDQKFSFRTAIYDAANDTIKFSIPVAEFGGDLNLLQDSTVDDVTGTITSEVDPGSGAVRTDEVTVQLDSGVSVSSINVGDVIRVAKDTHPDADVDFDHYSYGVITDIEDQSATTAGQVHLTLDPFGVELSLETHAVVIRNNNVLSLKRRSFVRPADSHVDYGVTIPNIIGFPEHKRCLCQVQSAWFYAMDTLVDINAANDFAGAQQTPPLVGVELMGVNPQNVFSSNVGVNRGLLVDQSAPRKVSNSMMIGYGLLEPIGINRYVNSGNDTSRNQRIAYGFKSFRPIVDDGVLISSPFGKGIRVRFVNMSSGQTLASGSTAADTLTFADAIQNNPTHLVMKLMFLDDDEVPNR
jgi:hypothetical protein